MQPDRQQRIESLYHAALTRPVPTRAAFLAEACASDAALQSEVESLLAHAVAGDSFLERSVFAAPVRLTAGQTVGHYQIVGPLGAGGMGEVYRARDTRLPREVAIKVLSAQVASAPDRRRRLEREAQAVSALNHPHICTLHDVGHQDGLDFLVMELVEGRSLAERLAKGPMPFDEALACAIEIADALSAAHRRGIVHRDLKPGNVMLTKSGAKLLDFGLARFVARAAAVAAVGSMDSSLTEHGAIVGTLQYMAPEQIEGREADARSDIFAFGAVLYEMVTGRRAFEGESQASLMSAILRDQPPLMSSVRPVIPAALDRIVRTCLDKDPDSRWQSAADLARALRWAADEPTASAPSSGTAVAVKRPLQLWAGAGLGLGVAVTAVAVWALSIGWHAPQPSGPTHLQIDLMPAGLLDSALQELNRGNNSFGTGRAQYAFSDTGALAYVTGGIHRDRTDGLVWIDLATGRAEALAATKGPYPARGCSKNPHLDEDLRPLLLNASDQRALITFLKALSSNR